MKAKSFSGMACSVAGALEAIGDRWGMLVLRDLSFGLTRFDQLKASTGAPNTTLSQRLKHLEAHGLIARRPYQDHPPRHDYELTAKGRDLWMVQVALAEWGDRWDASGMGAPPVERFDCANGRPVALALTDAVTGEILDQDRLGLRPGPGLKGRPVAWAPQNKDPS